MAEKHKGIPVFTFTHPETGEQLTFVPKSADKERQVLELFEWAHENGLPVGDCETRPPLTGSVKELSQGYN